MKTINLYRPVLGMLAVLAATVSLQGKSVWLYDGAHTLLASDLKTSAIEFSSDKISLVGENGTHSVDRDKVKVISFKQLHVSGIEDNDFHSGLNVKMIGNQLQINSEEGVDLVEIFDKSGITVLREKIDNSSVALTLPDINDILIIRVTNKESSQTFKINHEVR